MSQSLSLLASMLSAGQPSFQIPRVEVPAYKECEHPEWRVREITPPIIRGYFNGLQAPEVPNYVLCHRATNVVWMSLTPMELESHAFHIELAHGTVVVGGLGMGMYLYNLCLKESVTRVVVIELEPSVIAAFKQFSGCESWPGWSKVELIQADILDLPAAAVSAGSGCDYLYVDIWPSVGDMRALDDMTSICGALKPKQAGWWCQEFDYRSALKTIASVEEVSSHWATERGIPASGHLIPEYQQLVGAAYHNMMMA